MNAPLLRYCLVEGLANPAKQRLKAGDTNLGMWLESLAKFCGYFLRELMLNDYT